MSQRTQPTLRALAVLSMALAPNVAIAATGFDIGTPANEFAGLQSPSRCGLAPQPALGQTVAVVSPAPVDKMSALLGGQRSKLDAMRQQQAGGLLGASTMPLRFTLGERAALPSSATCAALALPSLNLRIFAPADGVQPVESDDFLASKRLPIAHTGFDGAWKRVQRQRLPRAITAGLSRMAPRTGDAMLGAVNAWANARIRYVEDKDLYGQADYWAAAPQTLKRGAGDCEDIAIVKMQALAALGVPQSDMYLTIARDTVRNADHAMLVVKLDGRHWLLDNAVDRVLDASGGNDYRPIMSFSTSRKWLHGYSQL